MYNIVRQRVYNIVKSAVYSLLYSTVYNMGSNTLYITVQQQYERKKVNICQEIRPFQPVKLVLVSISM